MRWLAASLIVFLTAPPGWTASADEKALRTRALRFYELQISGNRAEAAKLVEPKSRNLFLNGKPVPYTSAKVDRVLISGEVAEVEVTVEMLLPLFSRPLSRAFPTPWKKIGSRWYFVVDSSAIQQVMSVAKPAVEDPRPALAYKPSSIVFGMDGEIQKSLRIENKSEGTLRFRMSVVEDDWLEVKNRSGEIPSGDYFPVVLVLKQIPRERQMLRIVAEAAHTDGRVTQLEIPVELQVPNTAAQKEMENALRKYRANQ